MLRPSIICFEEQFIPYHEGADSSCLSKSLDPPEPFVDPVPTRQRQAHHPSHLSSFISNSPNRMSAPFCKRIANGIDAGASETPREFPAHNGPARKRISGTCR